MRQAAREETQPQFDDNTSTAPTQTPTEVAYDATSIVKLEGPAAIRQNPGMYVGGTGPEGLHHLIWEVVDNSVDEALAGACSRIQVVLHADGSCEVTDNGRGIPVDVNPSLGNRPALEVAMTEIHAGGKFTKQSYKVSGGLHGVGLKAVNALSERLEATIWRDGFEWAQRFEKGKKVTELTRVRPTSERGTRLRFWPDPEIFPSTHFEFSRVEKKLKEVAYLVRSLEIHLVDLRAGERREKTFKFDGGIRDLVAELSRAKGPTHKNICEFSASTEEMGIGDGERAAELEVALQWTDDYSEVILTFANTVNTPFGGSHEQGFKKAITWVLNKYARESGYLKEKDSNFLGEDVRKGVTAVVSVRLTNPQYEGQTKGKLVNPEIEGFVQQVTNSQFFKWLEEHPQDADAIVRRVTRSAEERLELERRRKQERQKSQLEGGSPLPGKLADCTVKDPAKRELFIVEGDSAGGSAIKARNREFQAILPIKGKILNVEKNTLQKALSNDELRNLILAIGTGIGDNFDIDNLKYHKICILCDADVDGAHIRILLLTFFYRMMPALIEKGHVFVCRPPLYKATHGKKSVYLLDDQEKEKFLAQQKEPEKWQLSRHKGLGEMDAEELWDTTMDPAKRSLYQVTIEDAAAVEETVSHLMGEETDERKEFIAQNAEGVEMIDV